MIFKKSQVILWALGQILGSRGANGAVNFLSQFILHRSHLGNAAELVNTHFKRISERDQAFTRNMSFL